MGLKGATSNDSCIWCLIHKKDRQVTLLTFKILPAIVNNHVTMFHVYNYNKNNHCAFIPVGATCLWNITPTVPMFLCSLNLYQNEGFFCAAVNAFSLKFADLQLLIFFRPRPRLQPRMSIKSIHTTMSVISGLSGRYRPEIKIFEFKESHPQVCLWHDVLSNVLFRRKNLLFTQCHGASCKTTHSKFITITVTIEKMTTTTITIRLTTRIIETRRIIGW